MFLSLICIIFYQPAIATTTKYHILLKLCREQLLNGPLNSCGQELRLNKPPEARKEPEVFYLDKFIDKKTKKKSNFLYVKVKTCLYGIVMGMSSIGTLVFICQYLYAQNKVDDVEYQQNSFTQMRHMSRKRYLTGEFWF